LGAVSGVHRREQAVFMQPSNYTMRRQGGLKINVKLHSLVHEY